METKDVINKEQSVLDIPDHNLTPGMKQYRDAKKANPDCLIMLRMGDFYEMFYEDAVTAARELEITLTARGKNEKKAPLAGIPFHALEPYLGRLVKKGFKVAIVEQLEDPKKAKGLVKRGLVRIVTPGTVIESSMLNEKENNYIMCITALNDDFSIACCDLSTGEFFTRNISTNQSLINEVMRINPSECIIPLSLNVNTTLVSSIKATGTFLHSQDDFYFKEDKAKETLLTHFNVRSLDAFGIEGQRMNISVSGALLNYLVSTQKNSLSHIKNISLMSGHNKMILDSSTLRNLELLSNIRDSSTRGTLISVLDKTVTPMGSRLMKKWIKEPLLRKEVIEKRLNAVLVLNKNVILREEMIDLLDDVYDLERLISRVNYGNANPRDLLALRNSLQKIPEIKLKLGALDVELLNEINKIPLLRSVAAIINSSIKEEPPITIRDGGIIKDGYSQELDDLREIKNNSKNYLAQLEQKEKLNTGIPNLKLGYTRVFGYFIEVTKRNIHLVPSNYVRKQTTTNSERYITEELKVEEEKILGADEKINLLEYNLFQELLRKVSEKTSDVQEAANRLAALDVLCSFGKSAMEQNYVMPEISEESVLHIKSGRHPVVEQIEEKFISNDIVLNDGEMMIITGPNMSGKSTIMRQTALIVLMAQIGSFVPAEVAILGIVDRIFTRVGAHDDLTSGQSTFMVEMNEAASILNNATVRSLIILDEIGRGTSTFDGVSIAWSVAEHIHNNIKAKTLFATHYHVMNKLAEKCSRIKNYNVAVREVKDDIILLHKLVEGGTDQSHGIHVAKLAGIPSSVIERAKEIQTILERDDAMVRRIKAKKLDEQKGLEEF
jgi:DNA mismatch repair protein MutS